MATMRKQPKTVEFPFKGNDAGNLAAARCMAKAGFKKRPYKGKSVFPKGLVQVVLKGSRSTKQAYGKAYMQELAARELDNPVVGESEESGVSGIDECDPLGGRSCRHR
jgi:hypothetical protein